jgi:hypothetical protein
MLLRDEDDVIADCLTHLLTWIDGLLILDLGSVDKTWDIVNDFAARDKRIIPWIHKPIIYNDNLRSMMFDHFRTRFRNGDWVLRLDADEFYHVTPPDFVKQRLGALETAVSLQWYFFRLTTGEVADYESGKVDLMEDRKRSITDRRRFYKISEYAEPRMFKYRRTVQWPEFISFPYNAGFVARERIPIRHYPHRDPLQMERRVKLRAAMMKLKAHAGKHWKIDDWRKEIVDATGQSIATQTREGIAGERGIDTGALLEWKPGTPLAERPLYNHTKPFGRRVMQRLIHPLLLPLLDRRKPAFNKSFSPEYFSEEISAGVYQ